MELSQRLSASERRGVNSPSPQRPKFCTCVPAPLRLSQLLSASERRELQGSYPDTLAAGRPCTPAKPHPKPKLPAWLSQFLSASELRGTVHTRETATKTETSSLALAALERFGAARRGAHPRNRNRNRDFQPCSRSS